MFGAAPGIAQKALHLGIILIIFFLDYLAKEDRKWYLKVIDLILLVAVAGSMIYIISIDKTIDLRSGLIYTYDIIFGVLLIIALIEATRRSVGLSLSIVVLCFIAYAFFGPYMPGFLVHAGMDLSRLTSIVYLSTDGFMALPSMLRPATSFCL